MIEPDWKSQTGVGVLVGVAVGVGGCVAVGGIGVGGTRVKVKVSVGPREGVARLPGKLQPVTKIIISSISDDLNQRTVISFIVSSQKIRGWDVLSGLRLPKHPLSHLY